MIENVRTDWLDQNNLQALYEAKMAHIAAGQELYDLSMINPDFTPPRILIDKLLEATVKSSNHKYSVSRGIKKLRQAFAVKYQNSFDVSVDADKNICVTMGSKDALANSLLVSAKVGDKVLLPEPSYPAHVSACHMAGLLPVYFQLCDDEDRMLAEIRAKIAEHDCKVVLVNFPNNPTGQTVSGDFFKRLRTLAMSCNVLVINDFVYGEMGFAGTRQPSLLSVFEDGDLMLESYSLSKAYNVPGWRVGAMLGNARLIDRLARLKSHIDYGIFLPLQIAAAAALGHPQNLVAGYADEYERRARVLVAGLRKQCWHVQDPRAGAVVWAKIPPNILAACSSCGVKDFHEDASAQFAYQLLMSQGVFVSPGSIFGARYQDYVRFALVASSDKLYEVIRRLDRFESELLPAKALAL